MKEALYGLDAVRKVEMFLDRDEFVVTFNPAEAKTEDLIATITKAGYTAKIINGERQQVRSKKINYAELFPELFDRAKKEGKPVILDFHAKWCVPCKRLNKETFADSKVATLLKRFIVYKIDTDDKSDVSKTANVGGLPDIRFISPEGNELKQIKGFLGAELFADELKGVLRK